MTPVEDGALRWYQWHAQYDDLESRHTDRLEVVQELLSLALDEAPGGRLRAISICAGQARDLLPILINHPRGHDVSALLVELDPLNASFLHGAIGSTDLADVELLVADAGDTDVYREAVPADLVLMGGVFANVEAADARRTITVLPAMCRSGGTVVWSSYGPRLVDVDVIVAHFENHGFRREALRRSDDGAFVVAAHRYVGPACELPSGQRLFSFG